ncbi:MAG: S-layer homology domain-containing protein, partial [Clostridiales bacterium]|nr:S-layer homology domain-containing protein [Clostridiales bacterium]
EDEYIDEEIEELLETLDMFIMGEDENEFSSENSVEIIESIVEELINKIEEEDSKREYFLTTTHEALIKIDFILNNAGVQIEEEYFLELLDDMIELENAIYDEDNTEIIRKEIIEIANNYLSIVRKVVLDEQTVNFENGSAHAIIDFSDVDAEVDRLIEKKKILESKLEDLRDEDDTELLPELTIVLSEMGEEVLNRKIEMNAEVIAKIEESGIETVTFDMGHNSISLNQQVLASLEGSRVAIAANVIASDEIEIDNSLQAFDELEKLEIKVVVDGEHVTNFDEPIEMRFDVSSLDLENMNIEDLKALTVFRFNEETLEWENVGGWFDPITKTVRVFRMNLSKYSVMVSNKSFSNINNSRAVNKVNALLGKGIIKNEELDLDEEISRGEFTAWLLRTYGLTDSSAAIAFDDVTRDNSFFREINTAFQLGIVNGRGDGKFDPSAKLTQKEMALLIERASSLYGKLNNTVMAGDILDDVDRNSNGIVAFLNAAVFSVDMNRLEGTLGLISREQAASTIFTLGTTR